jgi:uncharacterized protein YukE
MSQAIIDPEEVRRFAAELKRFNGDLRERTASLMARFTALGDTWQDQEQEKFAGEFTQLMKSLRSFIEVSDRHTPYLLRKAERIQHYVVDWVRELSRIDPDTLVRKRFEKFRSIGSVR